MELLGSFFESVGLGAFDPALLSAFILALWALLLAVFGALRPRRGAGAADDELKALQRRIDALERQISELETAGGQAPAKKKAELPPGEGDAQPAALDAGLARSRGAFFQRLSELFGSGRRFDQQTAERFEELLISSDMGVGTSRLLLERAREALEGASPLSPERVQEFLKQQVREILASERPAEIEPRKVDGLPKVVLVVGVNGVGKTTTIGKLGARFADAGSRVMFAACDTFRAAAVEQLKIWGERVGAEVISGAEGAKPTTVAYQAVHAAREAGADVLLIDTAGRLHTRTNLMKELEAVSAIIAREQPGAPHETILVVDGSTGQNALQQARQFNDAANLSGIVITKLDGTPKGGIVVAIRQELGIAIRYIGVGEGVQDLREFDAEQFAEALFAPTRTAVAGGTTKGLRTATRRRRA